MKADWSQAPEWADSYGLVGIQGSPVWCNLKQYQHVEGNQSHRVFPFEDGGTFNLCEVKILARRPTKPQAPEWDGESAPAPGELAQTSSGKCEILGWDAQTSRAAVQWHDGELGIVSLETMKPLCTKGQRDREEAEEKALKEVYSRIGDDNLVRTIKATVSALYDAGLLRKGDS